MHRTSSNLTAPTIILFPQLQPAGSQVKKPINAAENLVVQLASIVEPLSLPALFPESQPLEIELGCGDASFLVEYAARHPRRNFVGVERLLGRISKLSRKGRLRGLANLRGVRVESTYFLKYLLPPHSAEAVHVYFPDPWPKKKHRKHRLINNNFPVLARQALTAGGRVFLRTDDADYFEQMNEVFGAAEFFRQVATPAELLEIKTDFEAHFNAQGIRTLHCAFQLRP